ncbi:hypothetical protein KMI_14g19360 [Encephalitozoon hellem]|nr:hypothetical protein KMI_14g19360 [Encephalitozoon hellem]
MEENKVKISITALGKESYVGVLCEYVPGKHIVLGDVVRRHIGPIENRKDAFVYPRMKFRIDNIKEIGVVGAFNGTWREEAHLVLEVLRHKALGLESRVLDEKRASKPGEGPAKIRRSRDGEMERALNMYRSPRIEKLSKTLAAGPTTKPQASRHVK